MHHSVREPVPSSSQTIVFSRSLRTQIHSVPSSCIIEFQPGFFQGQSIPDGVASLQANPLGNGPVLLLGLGQLLLGAERLVGLLSSKKREMSACPPHGMLAVVSLLGVSRGTYRHLDGVLSGCLRFGCCSMVAWVAVTERCSSDKFERGRRALICAERSGSA